MKSYQNEIFGPVLQIMEVNKLSDAINLINNNRFGNGCCIFTRNGEQAGHFQKM